MLESTGEAARIAEFEPQRHRDTERRRNSGEVINRVISVISC
jgi:hypothetical protein